MAVTTEGRAASEAHRRLQARLATLTVAQMRALWNLLDPEDLDTTAPAWLDASVLSIRRQHAVSAQVAERFYRRFRLAETGRTATTAGIPEFPEEAARTSLLVTGPVRIRQNLGRGGTLNDAYRRGFITAAAAGSRHALNGGRDLLLGSVAQDQTALGWARVTAAKPCAFCALLASRGPVYKTRSSASFQAHDACRCSVEPVYSRDTEWPGAARDWADLYETSASGRPDPTNAFRRAYEAA